jgi:hypothetical protein
MGVKSWQRRDLESITFRRNIENKKTFKSKKGTINRKIPRKTETMREKQTRGRRREEGLKGSSFGE